MDACKVLKNDGHHYGDKETMFSIYLYRRDIPMNGHAYTQRLVRCLNHGDKESTCAIPSSYRNF